MGTAYHGWQVQNNAVTVQQRINEALSTALGKEIKCMGSGRTDTGVHAIQQVAHFDHDGGVIFPELLHKLNGILPLDISVNAIRMVKNSVSARFDASSRSYVYKIHQNKDPFLIDKSYHFRRKVDLDKMNVACSLFKKHRDFQSFSMVKTDVNNYNCEIFEIGFKRENEMILFYVRANRFLRGMVRAIVGTMLDVGENKLSSKDLEEILESRDRKNAGRSVPACGLYLKDIVYPDDIYNC